MSENQETVTCKLYGVGRQITQFPPGRMSYERLEKACSAMEGNTGSKFDWYTAAGYDILLTDATDEQWGDAVQAVIDAIEKPHGGFYVRKSPPRRA